MDLAGALADLRGIFTDYRGAVRDFIARGEVPAREILLRRYLPLVLLYPLAALVCPYSWILGGGVSLRSGLLFPLFLVGGFVALALIYDRIFEHLEPPDIREPGRPRIKSLSLFLHLPLVGAGIFFILHPAIGYLMLFVSAGYSIWLSLRVQMLVRRISAARALTGLISAVIFLLIPVVVLLFALNIRRTIEILLDTL